MIPNYRPWTFPISLDKTLPYIPICSFMILPSFPLVCFSSLHLFHSTLPPCFNRIFPTFASFSSSLQPTHPSDSVFLFLSNFSSFFSPLPTHVAIFPLLGLPISSSVFILRHLFLSMGATSLFLFFPLSLTLLPSWPGAALGYDPRPIKCPLR